MSTVSKAVVRKLQEEFGHRLVAVAMFGSAARGEGNERSDLDFLVVLRQIPKSLDRRSQVYKPIRDATIQAGRGRDITVIDLDEEFIMDENAEVTPFMLNIASDAMVLYDREGELASFLERVRRLIEIAGLERYKCKDGKYGWKPKQGILRVVDA